MFVRLDKARNKDGTVREYLQIVESRRVKGKKYPQQRRLLNLARIDGMDEKRRQMLFNLARGILTALGEEITYPGNGSIGEVIPTIQKSGHKLFWGLIELCWGIWKSLGLDGACQKIGEQRRIRFSLERVLFAIVISRLYGRISEFSVHRWLKKAYPGYDLTGIELHHLYRGLTILGESWRQIEDRLRYRVLDLFHQKAEVLFLDTTSIIYWGEGNDELIRHGHSREKRGDKKQVVIGVALVNGLPIGIEVEPGNTSDIKVMRHMVERFQSRVDLWEVCIVSDSGMVSLDEINKYHRHRWQYLVRARVSEKVVKEKVKKARDEEGKWEVISDGLWGRRFKVPLGESREEHLIVVRNEIQEDYDRQVRETILKKLRDKQGRDVKELIKNRGYNRYLASGNVIRVDETKVEKAAMWDGIWVVRTNRQFHSLQEVVERYKELWQVEKVFRDIKNLFDVSPIYHSDAVRIEGHIYACFLSLLLGFTIQRMAKGMQIALPYEEMMEELRSLHLEWIQVGKRKLLIRDELSQWQKNLFKRFKITLPPSILEVV
jgi:transposase